MSEQTDPETLKHWHRTFAMQCNNIAWDLAARETRTPVDDHHMLSTAFASAYHWAQLKSPLNDARADVTVAHVLALLNQGPLALEYARRCLAFFESQGGEDWDLAFAHAELAHAAAKCGDHTLHSYHYARARELGEAIQEADDRQVFLEEFARIPRIVA